MSSKLTPTELEFVNRITTSLLNSRTCTFNSDGVTLSNKMCSIDKSRVLTKDLYTYYLKGTEFKTYYEDSDVYYMFQQGLAGRCSDERKAKEAELRKALDANAS